MKSRCALIRERGLAGRRMWFRRIRPSGESGFGAFRPAEGLLRGPPSGEGPFTGHSALPAPPDSHVPTNAVPITMNARQMPPRRAAPVASSYGDFCTVLQQTALDFDMVPGVLGDFSRSLFDTGVADLGKCWRPAAFGVDSACKTAQKSHSSLTRTPQQARCRQGEGPNRRFR